LDFKNNTALERDGQGKKNTKENERTKTKNQKLIRRESKVRHDLTFINSDATRDGEGSVWRLVGPGSDSELIRPRCALRRGAACGLETRASIDSLYKLEESQEKKLNGSLIRGGGRSRFGRACEAAMRTSCFSLFKTLIVIYFGDS
jgi:hypothetical protein